MARTNKAGTYPIEIHVGGFGFMDMTRYNADPSIYGKLTIPNRFVTPGGPDQLTRTEFAEMLLQEFEAGLVKFNEYVNEQRAMCDLGPADLPYGYKEEVQLPPDIEETIASPSIPMPEGLTREGQRQHLKLVAATNSLEEAEKWLEQYADNINADFDIVMHVADDHYRYATRGGQPPATLLDPAGFAGGHVPDVFWKHFCTFYGYDQLPDDKEKPNFIE